MEKQPFFVGHDALLRPLRLDRAPSRVISLVPSWTEYLFDLGLGDRLVGRTRYCIHPKKLLNSVAEVGGTKQVDFDQVARLEPDLVIAEKEENPKTLVEAIEHFCPVYVSEVTQLDSALSSCRAIGKVLGLERKAELIAQKIEKSLKESRLICKSRAKVLYLIWRKPWMAVGPETFIHSCLEHAGFENVIKSARYPELSVEELSRLRPDRVFLSSEPFPFQEKHSVELRTIFPQAKIEFVDGELFSWYGTRMLKMSAYWKTLVAH